MSHITTRLPAAATWHPSRAPRSASRSAGPRGDAAPAGPPRPARGGLSAALPLATPRSRSVRTTAAAGDGDMVPSAEAFSLAMAMGGPTQQAAITSAPFEAARRAAARMRQHPDPGIRRAFVSALACRTDGAALLADFVRDPDENVRHTLVQNAIAWKSPAARAMLRAMAADPKESAWVAQHAVRTLAAHGDAEALLALRADPRMWVRLTVAEGLAKLAPHGLLGLLTDDDAWVRNAALQGVAAPIDARWVQALGEMALVDPVAWVRHAALRTLALHDRATAHRILRQLPGPQQAVLVGTVTRMAPHAPERWAGDVVRRLEDMAGMRHQHDLPELHRDRTADPHVTPQVRAAAQSAALEAALGILHDPHSTPERLRHAGALVWQTPAEVELAGMLGGPAAPHLKAIIPALDRLRYSPRVEVRRMLPRVLRQLAKEPTTLPMLAALADDDDDLVRQGVAGEIFQLSHGLSDHAPCIPIVRQLLQDPVVNVRVAAAGATRELAAAGSETLQAMAARDSHAQVRKAVIWPLCHRRSVEAMESLRRLARDPDVSIRATVASTVAHLPMGLAYPLLSVFAHDTHPEVRTAFMGALHIHIKKADEAPRGAELALHALDAIDVHPTDREDVRKRLQTIRSQVLAQALVAFSDRYDILTVLHGWVANLQYVDVQGIEALLACSYPQRGALLAQLLDNPSPAVRQLTRDALARGLQVRSGL